MAHGADAAVGAPYGASFIARKALMADLWVPVVTAVAGFGGGVALDTVRRWEDIRYGSRAKRILKAALEDEAFEWRKIETLVRLTGCQDQAQLRRWLIRIGARQSGDNADIWTTKSKEQILSDEERKRRLRLALADGAFHPIDELAAISRVTAPRTERLLVEIGAIADGEPAKWRLPV